MARYAKIAGGNWSSANTWSATSSAGVDNAGAPTSSDDVIMDVASATTGNLVIDAAAVAKTFTSTSNVSGTLTHGDFTFTVFGNLAFGTGMTYTPSSGASIVIGSSAAATTFAGVGKTFKTVSFLTSTQKSTISGSNTFSVLQGAVGGTKNVTLTAATTQTITGSMSGFGNGTNVLTLAATAGVVPILTKSGGGIVNADYLNIQGVNVTPASTWYYGTHSTDGVGLDFNGEASAGGYVSAANSAGGNQWKGSTSFSVEAWILPRTVGGGGAGRIINKATSNGYILDIETGTNPNFYGYFSGGSIHPQAGSITYGVLNHIVGVWDGTNARCYLNTTPGSDVSSSGTPLDDSAVTSYFGNRSGGDRTFDGQIFAVRIYRNVALSAPNVSTLYSAGPKAVNPLGNATAEYLMNEGTGATVTDSISANNGTITGALWANTGWQSGSGSTGRKDIILGMYTRIAKG